MKPMGKMSICVERCSLNNALMRDHHVLATERKNRGCGTNVDKGNVRALTNARVYLLVRNRDNTNEYGNNLIILILLLIRIVMSRSVFHEHEVWKGM